MTSSGTEAVDERHPPRPRGHRPREAPEVRRRLPRPRRRPAGRGRQRPGHAGHPGQPGRARERRRRDGDRAVERPGRGRSRRCAEHDFAAILAEPYPANMGLVPPDDGLPRAAARDRPTATARCSSSTRSSPASASRRGGAQELTGVTPDLTIMGKVIGGGLPAAAYGGPRELMERIAPAGDVYQAGTLSGNPLAVAAGLTTLRLLDDGAYAGSSATTDGARRGPARRPRATRPVQVVSAPGLLTVFFSEEPVRDYAGRAGLRPRGLRAPGAARCWRAASTRRRRSSRPGSRRSPTRRSTSSARSRPRRRRSRSCAMSVPAASASRRESRARGRPAGRRARRRRPRRATPPRRARGRRPARGGPRGGPRARRRGGPRGLPPALRRRRARRATAPTPTWRCSPATGSTRSASPAWPRWATSTRSRELADVIALVRPGPRRRRRRRSPRPSGRPGAAAVGWGAERRPARPPRPPRARASRAPRRRCEPPRASSPVTWRHALTAAAAELTPP